MRVTAEVQRQTRERLLAVAARLFARDGFARTTTRDLSTAARVAPGTLFNYFPSKESLALALIAAAFEQARAEFEHARREGAGLAEELFEHVVLGLRALEPFRSYAGEVFERALSPFAARDEADAARAIERAHLETVDRLLAHHGVEAGALALRLYWTLYVAVLASWAGGASRDETLALLDQSTRMFAASLSKPENQES